MNGSLHSVSGRSVLRFERRLAHPVEKVWRAITDPAELAHWYPSAVEMEFREGGKIRQIFSEDDIVEGVITELDPPRVFEFVAYTADMEQAGLGKEQTLRFELYPEPPGCLLVFTNTFDDRASAASFATGWNGCLDALETAVLGEMRVEDLPKLWEKVQRSFVESHENFVERFGLLEGTVRETPDGYELRFDRQLPHPPEKVWGLLAGDDEVSVGGSPPLRFTNGFVPAGPVTTADTARLLEYDWLHDDAVAGRVRWEFVDGPGGVRLTLTETLPRRLAELRATGLGAWHTHLELLADHLRGRTPCWPEGRTEELTDHYARLEHKSPC